MLTFEQVGNKSNFPLLIVYHFQSGRDDSKAAQWMSRCLCKWSVRVLHLVLCCFLY